MNHRTGLARTQTLLFPETLDDYISAENPVRFLDAFVAGLDLHGLGFAKAIPEPTGRPPYLKALEEADAQEAQCPEPLSREQLQEKITQLQERKDWYEGLEVELQGSEEKQISLSDPEARRMHTTPGSVVGYNAQVAVDAKNKLIAAAGLHTEPSQPDDHAGGKRAFDGGDGPASQGAAPEDEVEKATLRASLWDDQAMVWLHPLSVERAGESAGGVEPDHALLQPQTGVEAGQL